MELIIKIFLLKLSLKLLIREGYDDYGNITQYVTKDPKNDTIIERTEYKYQEMK